MTNSSSKESLEQISSGEDNVFYCARCLSLAIKIFRDQDFCIDCGSTDIKEASFKDWEAVYKSVYGVNYINNKENNGRKENESQ